MYYYQHNGTVYASFLPQLPLEAVDNPDPNMPQTFLLEREGPFCRAAFCVTDPRQLTAETEDLTWLDPARMDARIPQLPRRMQRLIDARTLRAVSLRHPHWDAAEVTRPARLPRRRVHLLALGDVGGTLLTALRLLGGDCVESIGIHDLDPAVTARWTAEMNQISWPMEYDLLPPVKPVSPERLFDCEVFIFAAARGVPPVGDAVDDVRMAQLAANREIVESCARHARTAGYKGLFAVVSDPVDPLCKAAYLASNQTADGVWDGQGLRSEQVQGFGLGVMNARAADIARQDPRFHSFLEEGRSFGPHGRGLVIANSLTHYDDALSQELTERTLAANLRIRELGFKPYVAPALSSGAMQLLLMLRGQWHYSSVGLGSVWMGVRNRFTPAGMEIETAPLPDPLFARLQEAEALLSAIL